MASSAYLYPCGFKMTPANRTKGNAPAGDSALVNEQGVSRINRMLGAMWATPDFSLDWPDTRPTPFDGQVHAPRLAPPTEHKARAVEQKQGAPIEPSARAQIKRRREPAGDQPPKTRKDQPGKQLAADRGRPGRAAPRAPVKCYNCDQPGHRAAQCPVAGGLALEAPVRLETLEGKRVADVLQRLEPEADNLNAGDDPRIEAECAPTIAVVEEEDPLVVRIRRQASLRTNLKDKAVTMLLTKNLDSNADMKVVLQNLVQLSRKEKMYELFDDPQGELMRIYSAAVKKAFDLRLTTAKDLSISRVSKSGKKSLKPIDSYVRGVQGLPNKYDSWEKKAISKRADLEILNFYEETKRFSLIAVNNPHRFVYWTGLFHRLCFSLLAEKFLYVFLIVLVAYPGVSPLFSVLCPQAPFPSARSDLSYDEFMLHERRSELYYESWEASVGGQCTERLVGSACFVAFVILLIVEGCTLSFYYKKWSERIPDFFLRAGFHGLDAVLSMGLIKPTSTAVIIDEWCNPHHLFNGILSRFVDCTGMSAGQIDWVFVLSVIVFVFHFLWNCTCIFSLHQPHRCFSVVEAVAYLFKKEVFEDTCLENEAMKTHPVQEDFKCCTADPTCQPKASIFSSWRIAGIIPTVFANCSHNEILSMNGRVGKLLPAHASISLFKSITKNWVKLITNVGFLIEMIPASEQPMDFYEWCCTFPPTRRDELLRTRVDTHDMPPLTAKSFIKREVAPKCEDDIVFKDPRFIQGCPLELSAAVGPTLRSWTKLVKSAIGPEGFTPAEVREGKHILYTCGRSNEEIGSCFKRAIDTIEEMAGWCEGDDNDIVFLEDDQSRFDLHLTKGPFKFLKTLYSRKLSRRVSGLLRRGISKGTSSLGTRYSIPFTMQSGWPDTSVGDTLVNAAMKFAIHGKGNPWISIICGDDSVTVTTKGEIRRLGGVDGIIASYASYGMEVEASVSDHPLDVGFCSGRFYPVGSTYVLFPKPGRLMSKIACDTKRRDPQNHVAWLRGIVATLSYYGRVDPLLGALSRGLGDGLGTGKVIYDSGWEHKQFFDGTVTSCMHDVYMYYDHHYGFCVQQVDNLIQTLQRQRVGNTCADTDLYVVGSTDVA